MTKKLSHLDTNFQAKMVDVSAKELTHRIAKASCIVEFPKEVMAELQESNFELKKGSILQTAQLAGIMALKNTWNTIPLCHQIPISGCTFIFTPIDSNIKIECTVKTNSNTGVEMEALHGVSIAALTIYDMCKALSHDIIITGIQLEQKSGGKRDFNRNKILK